MARSLWLGFIALALLAAEATAVRADAPAGPWPWSKAPDRSYRYREKLPPSIETDRPQEPPTTPTQQEDPPRADPPKRTGPFRSCGSGMGLGLAGIGLTWGLVWLGTRFAGRVARQPKTNLTR